jgi:hypothetical protein
MDWSKLLTWSEFWAWSEVWALLIPLTPYFIKRNRIAAILKPIVYYLFIAFTLNFLADFSWRFQSPTRLNLPDWAKNNIPVYHIHSIVRLLLLAWFFSLLKESFLVRVKKSLPYIFLVFVVIYYLVIKSPRHFLFEYNSILLATEAAIMLFFCLQHYVYLAQAEPASVRENKGVNWIIAGLTIYFGINFFIFLFYSVLSSVPEQFQQFSEDIWEVHNISYILLCCFIAKGLYESGKSRN